MLRSRRPRHRHGAQLCAAISAVLLLISVWFLYTRLSLFSSPHRDPLAKGIPDETDPTILFPDSVLVSDSDEGGVGNSGGGGYRSGEDRIDERDDDATAAAEDDDVSSEEDESQDAEKEQVPSSGFYFDHVNGVVRRAFNRKSIDEWDYDYAGFSIGSGKDDSIDAEKSKAAFGSDDFPVDEAIRRKMSQVSGIEDALLIPTGKGSNSPLRQGWGDWFEKKGDFLRRDRMFKSNLEVLNPLNNPMLRDPDSIGVTGFTRGDRVVQKWILNEFKRVPFLGKKPLSVLEKREGFGLKGVKDESKFEEGSDESRVLKGNNMVMSNKLPGAERRTLEDDLSNERKKMENETAILDGSLNEKHPDDKERSSNATENRVTQNGKSETKGSSVSITAGLVDMDSRTYKSRNEFSGHIYADGTRWGYYPGLNQNLSFSDFMDAFFRMNNCNLKAFMVWNSPPWMYSIRHQRGLESLLTQHRDACVVVFSETIELDFFRESFVRNGHKVAVAMPNLDELLKDTPTHVFASVWFDWRKTKFYATHYSELVRLAALYKYGGVYLDSDIIVLHSLSSLKNTVGMEDEAAGGSLNGAVMAFRKHSPFLLECLNEYYLTYDDKCLRCNGADLLTRVSKRFLNGKTRHIYQQEITVQPSSVFFPISSHHITSFFTSPTTESEKAQQEAAFKKILNESLTFHFWNSITSSLTPEQDSLVARFIGRFCIRCSDVL